MMRTTPARMSRMLMPKRNENASPKISTPIHTAVTGSRAPMMAEGVEPIRLIEIVMKKSESTVGRRANCRAHPHCIGVWSICRLSPDNHENTNIAMKQNTKIQKVNFRLDMVVCHWLTAMM